ncbi:hypothetical protein [Acinetobacter bereziniae]|uniref:hypothetical protein n=1 Tax=Acinetobacter bereziniae TaxID=106648 RepID=UPI00295597A3|nr:hypothetical protein [Acinetobacter bereziniae]MDV8156379.1 hypothetical protein [Acinetobacter bereziniae]
MESKYLIKLVLSSLIITFSLYYVLMGIHFDICKYTFCFKYVNVDQFFTIVISLINIFIIIYGLDNWKKQANINRNIDIYKNLLINLDSLEESRCCYELLISTFNREIQQNFNPELTLLFHDTLLDKFKETRYTDISKISKYNSYSLHLANFFPNFNYNLLNQSHKNYLDIIESIYISINTKNYRSFKTQIEIYFEYNINYKNNLKKLRILISNQIFIP